jgi:hypothetical protein
MGFKIGVLLIHGIGNQDAAYADHTIEELKQRVRRLGSDDREICFEPVWWAPILAEKETTLLRAMSDGHDLDWMALRRFVVQTLADAIAYQDTPEAGPDQINVYHRVHRAIRDKLRDLRDRIRIGADPAAPEAPLMVIAHSLGCHMVSNCIWDVQSPRCADPPANAFERFGTLAAMITFGCNIPLFTLAYTNLEPIHFPTPGIDQLFPGASAADVAAVTQWLNFYDPDDVLGYPMRPLDPKYAATVSRDIAINAGGLLRSWNPASHTAYWTDNDVTKPTAELLHRMLRLLPPPA